MKAILQLLQERSVTNPDPSVGQSYYSPREYDLGDYVSTDRGKYAEIQVNKT